MLAFARRCRDFGVDVHIIDVRDEEGPQRFPGWMHAGLGPAMKWTDVGTSAGLERIRRFVESVGADALISADELTLLWLAKNRDVFEPRCRLMAPAAELLERMLSKEEQIRIAARAGFPLLPTWAIEKVNDGEQIPDESFPVCVRPTYPLSVSPAFKAKVLVDRADLLTWLGSLEWIRRPLVAQPFRVGPNLVVHGACDSSGKLLALHGYWTVRKFEGFAQSIEVITLRSDVERYCREFIEAAGLTGPFHFDLLHSDVDDCTYFLEVNVRLGGTSGKVVGLGYDEPALAFQSFGLEPPRLSPMADGRRRVTSVRSVAKQLVDTLKGAAPCEFRYPCEGRTKTLLHAMRELISVRDPAISGDDPGGSALYLFRPN